MRKESNMFQFEADGKAGERFHFACPHCGEEITGEEIIRRKPMTDDIFNRMMRDILQELDEVGGIKNLLKLIPDHRTVIIEYDDENGFRFLGWEVEG